MSIHATDFPHIPLSDGPLHVLTNQACEDTGYWTPQQFTLLGIDYGKRSGQNYPLTDEEAKIISDKHAMTPADGDLMFGYTALFQGRKWLIPSIEYMKPVNRRKLADEKRTLKELVNPYHGRVVREPEGPEDRVTIIILVPLKEVQEAFGHASAWERYLERGLGIPSE